MNIENLGPETIKGLIDNKLIMILYQRYCYLKIIDFSLIKQLNDLKPTERPIHCSDTKRLKFYVKEDDKWQPDVNNQKIDETLTNIKFKALLFRGVYFYVI